MSVDMENIIGDLIASRGITLAELTSTLGYQSKTSLVRIMKKQTSQRALETFAQRLRSRLALSGEELSRLNRALDHQRWQEDYESSQEMLHFLRGRQSADAAVTLEDVNTGERMTLEERYASAREIHITLLNCQYVPVFQQLLRMVRGKGAEVEHFLMMREDSAQMIHAINALIPLIYERGYTGYSYRAGESGGVRGVLGADLMVIRCRDAEGEPREELIVFDGECHGFVRTEAQPGSSLRMLGLKREAFAPVKTVYFQGEGVDSYLQFCADYARLEYNRSIYKIKPDVGLEWIPEDILVAALEGGSLDLDSIREVVEAFSEIYRERVRNVYGKRRATKLIMKRSAMVRFARSGRLTDHFWAMRPFTVEERVRILQLLLDQVENNVYCDLYFLKENDFLRDAEIAWYDGVGVLVMDANTDYALEGNHSEVMLVHSGFMRMFKEYFERSLLAEHVMSHSETVSFMHELIRIASCEE